MHTGIDDALHSRHRPARHPSEHVELAVAELRELYRDAGRGDRLGEPRQEVLRVVVRCVGETRVRAQQRGSAPALDELDGCLVDDVGVRGAHEVLTAVDDA